MIDRNRVTITVRCVVPTLPGSIEGERDGASRSAPFHGHSTSASLPKHLPAHATEVCAVISSKICSQ